MQDLNKYLIGLADRLDSEGKKVCADVLDQLIASNSMQKVAQYVGVIGYVLKQNRAMGNCIRKKRVESSASMQDVVLQCLKEYQDGQDYQNDQWHAKYAQVITQYPTKFTNAHLSLLAKIGNDEEIAEHINRVEKTTAVLKENEVTDELFNKVLSHVKILGDMLRKETESSRPFKVAAPPSPRGRWSRLHTPSEFRWWNPRSWRGEWRERGEDKDTMREMDSLLENLRSIIFKTQQMQTAIYQLKNQVAGFLSRSHTDLPEGQLEQSAFVENVVNRINELDPNDWNSSKLAIDKLQYTLSQANLMPQNEYNQQYLEKIQNLSIDLQSNQKQIYDNISRMQEIMSTLAQRGPVRGRGWGEEEGMSSPAEQFGVLDKILGSLYENPFDKRTQYYTQKMYSRLDSRLRSIKQDYSIPEEWVAPETLPPQAHFEAPTQEDKPGEVVTQRATPEEIKSLTDYLLSSTGVDARDIARLLTTIFQTSGLDIGDKTTQNFIGNLRDELLMREEEKSESTKKEEILDSFLAEDEIDEEYEDDNLEGDFPRSYRKYEDEHNANKVIAIKIADAMDKIRPDLADIIDEYIKEKDIIEPPKFPEFSTPIKEEQGNKETVG